MNQLLSAAPPRRRLEVIWWIASALLAIAGIAYVVRRGDLRESLLALGAVSGWLLAVSILMAGAALVARAIRWHLLMRPSQPVRFLQVLLGLLGAQTINAVAPLRVGDLARPYLLGGETSRMFALTTVVVEKWIDLFVVVGLTAILLVAGAVPGLSWPAVIRGIVILTIGVGAALGLTALVGVVRHRASTLSSSPWVRRVVKGLEAVPAGLRTLRHGGNIGAVVFWTAVVWGCTYAAVWTAMRSVSSAIPDAAVMTVLVLQYLGAPIPSPARLGTHQAITVAGLSLFHVSGQVALTGAIVLYLSVVFVPLLAGAGALWIIVHRFGANRVMVSSTPRDVEHVVKASTQ
jgi:uncharacterized membrane protein YbhN (UPF0104 family)